MKRAMPVLTQPGWAITIAMAVLLVIGLASISASRSVAVGGVEVSSLRFASRQAAVALIATVMSLLLLRIGYVRIGKLSYFVFAACLLALVPPVLARVFNTDFGGLVPEKRGSYRWLHLPGFDLQPSEMMKIGYIIGLAWYLRYRKNYRTFTGLLWPFLLSIVPMVLILLEPDLGTVLLFFPVLFGMLYVAGARLKHLGLIIALGVLVAPLMWFKLHSYQRRRIVAVALQSETLREAVIADADRFAFTGVSKREAVQWHVSSGMQLVRSKAALGSGGILGQGWGHGTYVEYNFLPDRHNDFVFAIVGHQWGLLGCLVVLSCYLVIVICGAEIALNTDDPFGRLLAMGVVSLISAQVLINVGMTIGLMPTTGMTLPFVSHGGSSLLANFLAVSLLISVSRHRPFILAPKPFEWTRAREERLASV